MNKSDPVGDALRACESGAVILQDLRRSGRWTADASFVVDGVPGVRVSVCQVEDGLSLDCAVWGLAAEEEPLYRQYRYQGRTLPWVERDTGEPAVVGGRGRGWSLAPGVAQDDLSAGILRHWASFVAGARRQFANGSDWEGLLGLVMREPALWERRHEIVASYPFDVTWGPLHESYEMDTWLRLFPGFGRHLAWILPEAPVSLVAQSVRLREWVTSAHFA